VNETAEVIEQTQSQETQPQETPVAFADSLGEEFKGNPIFKNFQDVNGLAKSYMHAQRMIGADKVAIPGKHATDAERLEVYQKLGAPVNIDGYYYPNAEKVATAMRPSGTLNEILAQI